MNEIHHTIIKCSFLSYSCSRQNLWDALLLKAALPEVLISVVAGCCAGVTPESHENALAAMKSCQIDVLQA